MPSAMLKDNSYNLCGCHTCFQTEDFKQWNANVYFTPEVNGKGDGRAYGTDMMLVGK